MPRTHVPVAIVLGCSMLASSASAQCEPQQVAKLLATDGAAGDAFGWSVGADGDTMVVGAPQDDGSGSAYVFERDGGVWSQAIKLAAPDAEAMDEFGRSVGISADTIVVGAPRDDDLGTDAGAIYVFQRVGGIWSPTAKLSAAGGAPQDVFGCAVAIDADTIVVGADGDDDFGPDTGSAYVFERIGGAWTQAAKLAGTAHDGFDRFGCSVALSGDAILVGAHHAGAMATGAAYVFDRAGGAWVPSATLTAADGAPFDEFGCSVSIGADAAIVGAAHDDDNGVEDCGSAYAFERVGNAWSQAAKLLPPGGGLGDGFGVSVAIDADRAVVGAIFASADIGYAGASFVFERDEGAWTHTGTIAAADGAAFDGFGGAVALVGDTAVVGASADDDLGTNAGSAYAFDLACACDADLNGDGQLDVLDFVAFQLAWQGQDTAADCDANGVFNVLDFVCFQQDFVVGCN